MLRRDRAKLENQAEEHRRERQSLRKDLLEMHRKYAEAERMLARAAEDLRGSERKRVRREERVLQHARTLDLDASTRLALIEDLLDPQSDGDVTVTVEKTPEEVLQERVEAAKRTGNFFSLE